MADEDPSLAHFAGVTLKPDRGGWIGPVLAVIPEPRIRNGCRGRN